MRDLSEASDGEIKLKGPDKRVSGWARAMVSAQAMYLEGLGVMLGLNSMRSKYSMTPSLAVR